MDPTLDHSKLSEDRYNIYLQMVPSIVLAIVIGVTGWLYNIVAVKLVDLENHRD